MKTLFKNCAVLQRGEDGHYTALENAYLGTDGKYIDYISTEAPAEKYDLEKDMTGKLLIPGLVNAHDHSSMTVLRGVGSGLPLQRWLFEAIFPVEGKMTKEDIVSGTRWAVMEMLASGTTLCSDMYDFPYDAAKVFEEAGMKVNTGRVLQILDQNMPAEKCERLTECVGFMDNTPYDPDNLVRADIVVHSEYLSSESTVRAIAEAAKKYNCTVQIHVSETKSEHEECKARHNGLTPVAYLEKCGLLDTPTYMAHCVWVEDEDLEIMKKHNCTLVHNPTSNMKLGSGFAPVPKALAAGVNVAIGTDGCASNNNLNMFEEMHLASVLHKGRGNDPTLVTCDQLIDMATVNGAKALGRFDTGELKPGKKADIAAIDLNKVHLKPAVDIPALLAYSAQGSDVVMTMVDGKILYEDGKFLTIDEKAAEKALMESVNRLLG